MILEVKLATRAGFCFGVTRAVEIAQSTAREEGVIYTLGPLIHNPQVVNKLAGEGIKEVDEVGKIPPGSTVIIPAHGIGPEVMEQIKRQNLKVVNATCPFVLKAQDLAGKLSKKGVQVVVLGDREHPEVKGIVGCTNGQAVVVEGSTEAESLPFMPEVAVLAQTTQPLGNFQAVVEVLHNKTGNLKICNTICNATVERQKSTLELARQVQAMVVVGGANSANTRRLAELSKNTGTPTYHIESAEDLNPLWFYGKNIVGLTAGASTPHWIIEEVQRRMKEMNEMTATGEERKEVTGIEEGAEEKENFTAQEEMKDVVEVRSLRPGQTVKGLVVQTGTDEVLVDVGAKSEGVIPLRELSAFAVTSPEDVVKVGDEIEVVVVRVEDNEGRMILSKARADARRAWESLAKHMENGESVEGVVREVVKGGLLVDIGLRAFLPASLVERSYVEDLSTYLGAPVKAKVIELNRSRRKVILSRKAVLEEEEARRRKEVLANLEEGQVVKGVVRRLTNFGAFVDIGGIDGLLHISEMAWYRIDHPSDILNVGDEIDVKILKLDRENEKISLGLKQVLPNPWDAVNEKYPAGSVVRAKVVRLAPFGAFVQLEPGIEGLIHISHLSDHHVETPGEVVQVGDEVEAKVLNVDSLEKRMRLSIREFNRDRQRVKDLQKQRDNTANITIGEVVGDILEKPR